MKSTGEFVLVTGGAGYIGSHATLLLLQAGYNVLVIDNLENGFSEVFDRIKLICGRSPKFILGDVCDHRILDDVFAQYTISAVMHFAGLKAVGESVALPLKYYGSNVSGTLALLETMTKFGVFNFVFSSSATVYGSGGRNPLSEEDCVGMPSSPYGRTKLMIETVLQDLCASDPRWSVALLRYFNPIGAHESGLLGENPRGTPNNLLPYVSKVAVGALSELTVFGDDYPTPDGTGVRDYIHVVDLVEGHLKALDFILSGTGINTWNLGTGVGNSVLEIIHEFELISGKKIPFHIAPRRSGDVASCWADPTRAQNELGWKAKRSLADMVADTWRWQSKNPTGYSSE